MICIGYQGVCVCVHVFAFSLACTVYLFVSVHVKIVFAIHQISRCFTGPLALKRPVADY